VNEDIMLLFDRIEWCKTKAVID